ncbi:MAG: hypothetical protein HQQ73_04655 [Desulfobulbaceae bacterium]|nr:hypothetical protein [Desulfobulbaceae bacterium]
MTIVRQKVGIFIVAFATLMLELALIRVFDVILDPSIGYMILTIAMFSLGLGGIYIYFFRNEKTNAQILLPILSLCYAFFTVMLLFFLNNLPFHQDFRGNFFVQILAWVGMYFSIVIPFFVAGIILSLIFSMSSKESHGLYFADLLGAGLGCLLLMPLIPFYGPGGILFLLAGMLCIASFSFSSFPVKNLSFILPFALALMIFPLVQEQYLEFSDHANKRGTDTWKGQGLREYVKWDPVSKLEVFSVNNAKYFSLDGGQQASWMGHFDGDFTPLKEKIRKQPDTYYFGLNSLVHYLKRKNSADTLILGVAVGGEPRAALLFGARQVDAIEMVAAMVNAAKQEYASFSGNIFNHPQVRYQTGEARTFLRSTDKKYDVIQMFSNHTSSSIAQGSGALGSVYLQTVEAYEEYFSHLKDDGILSINRHFYPRMLTTAALAWSRQGRTDFTRHVLVFERYAPDTLPTVLIKMSPWTPAEVEEAREYLNRELVGQEITQVLASSSQPVLQNHPFEASFISGQDRLSELSLLVGTHKQQGLPYRIALHLHVDGRVESSILMHTDGHGIADNGPMSFVLPTPLENMRGRQVTLQLVPENDQPEHAFSVWIDTHGRPMLQENILGGANAYRIAFNPCEPERNMLPESLFSQPFPHSLAATADYRLSPVDDNRPFFNMIRKNTKKLSTDHSSFLDGGTAQILNQQLLPFLSKDIISFFVVGGISILFAALFIFVPLQWTTKGGRAWPAMPWFLLYFSCLGAGFIIIELTLIQLCIKLIGYPSFTFTTVLFALLFSAAIGSLASKKMSLSRQGRWPWLFIALIMYGVFFLLSHQTIFASLLHYGLFVRCLAATLFIFPLGFFLGMPFPLGLVALGQRYPQGIPWAWGMNGFFTVLGGFLSLVSAFFLGFRLTVLIALLIYLVALFAYGQIVRIHADPA